MARLYADEDFPLPVVHELRRLGHDVLTVQDAGRAGQGNDDSQVIVDAATDRRAVVTHNHADFNSLHWQGQPHEGIVSCTRDPQDHKGLAQRVHAAIAAGAATCRTSSSESSGRIHGRNPELLHTVFTGMVSQRSSAEMSVSARVADAKPFAKRLPVLRGA